MFPFFTVGVAEVPEWYSRQQDLMIQLIGRRPFESGFMNLSQNTKGLVGNNADDRWACRWRGVTCDKPVLGHALKISWAPGLEIREPVNLVQFHLQWLPPTLREIEIYNQRTTTKGTFSTRYFPRDARSIYLDNNGHRASLDLATLPVHLEVLSLEHNYLQGPVTLTRLPPTLKVLNLRYNCISVIIQSKHMLNTNGLPGRLASLDYCTDLCKLKSVK
mmetsp:Transcript_27651/g.42936  ORF Transcript_27651/g.42936 Transcript_27651/m.42936 type:complete len:218 (-) Transcript_27651:64-717(-)